MEETVGHQVLHVNEDAGRENPRMRRNSRFWSNWFNFSSRRNSRNNLPVSEAGVYPGAQHFNQVDSLSPDEDVVTKTTIKMEAILVVVNLNRTPLKISAKDDDWMLTCFADSLVPFTAELWLGTKKLTSRDYEQTMGKEIHLHFGALNDTVSKLSLVLHSQDEINPIISEGRMAASAQISELTVSESANGSIDVRLDSQRILIGSYEMDLLEIFGQPHLVQIKDNSSSPSSGSSTITTFLKGSTYDVPGLNRECVVCLSMRRDTLLLPCRHMCLCLPCAESLCLQSDKCPICRQEFRSLLNIRQV